MDPVRRRAAPIAVALLTLGVALGSASRLTYHEAIVAQGAREMLASGDWLVPTLGGQPWIEKPPLAHWLVAMTGLALGRVDETAARLPSALAAVALAAAVDTLAARHFGRNLGLLAALVQLTTLWTIRRGRLAEADILLAALVAWTITAWDRARARGMGDSVSDSPRCFLVTPRATSFFCLLGATSLAKGLGFGAALVLAAITTLLIWDRDRPAARALLLNPAGWLLAAILALAWPFAVLARNPQALDVWTLHVADRVGGASQNFAGETWGEYALAPLAMTLPWTPLALGGAWRSWRRARTQEGRLGPDRLLWAWAVVPTAMLSMASVRNGHYLIHALPPWSIWAALGLARLGERLRARGWPEPRIRRAAAAAFAAPAVACAVGFAALAPRLDRRGVEWSWYRAASARLDRDAPLVLLYDDWDRDPYPTPFGPVPHDLAVRLFYLDRPGVTWHRDPATLRRPDADPFAVIGRDRDVPALARLGRVTPIDRGPRLRARASKVDDRAFALYRVEPATAHMFASISSRYIPETIPNRMLTGLEAMPTTAQAPPRRP